MATELSSETTARSSWSATQVYVMAAVCLLLGVAIGYLFRGSQSPAIPAPSAGQKQPAAPLDAAAPAPAPTQTAANVPPSAPANSAPTAPARKPMPTLDDMKKMADTKAQPLLTKLKTEPKNSTLLIQVGNIYESTHQFKDAAGYYDKALQITPKNVALRNEMASCLFYSGDVDGAVAALQQSLKYDPKNANSLFNLGMIKLQGKQDGQGALDAWRELLKSNPELDANHKATVEKLIADLEKKGKS
jgi:cytochrome c-type biogenesis protein CcmH/NrfG